MRNLEYGVREPIARTNYSGSQADNQRPMQYAIKCQWLQEKRGIAASCLAAWSPRP